MPHSSGGGSHSGGSHRGSSHRSGSSSGSSARKTSYYRPGYHKYLYYTKNGPKYFYSADKITPDSMKKRVRVSVILGLLLLLFYSIPIISICLTVFKKSTKLNMDYQQQDIIVDDRLDILSDDEEEDLNAILHKFQEKTGITPSVLLDDNESWMNDYYSLEQYAYDIYVNKFMDEKHWLIVYTQPLDAGDNFVNWYWEGMQGNFTDSLLNETNLNKFNSELHKLLVQKDYTVGESFIEAFDHLNGYVMKTHFQFVFLFPLIFIILHGGVFFLFLVIIPLIDVKKDSKAIEIESNPDKTLKEVICRYCEKKYVEGVHKQCPHCGADIPPESDDFYFNNW